MTDDALRQLREMGLREPLVAELVKEYDAIMSSEVLETYMTLKAHVRDWNDQLRIEKSAGKTKGRIDLFAHKETKEFDRVFRYFSEIDSIIGTLERLRSKLTPSEVEDVKAKAKLNKIAGVAV